MWMWYCRGWENRHRKQVHRFCLVQHHITKWSSSSCRSLIIVIIPHRAGPLPNITPLLLSVSTMHLPYSWSSPTHVPCHAIADYLKTYHGLAGTAHCPTSISSTPQGSPTIVPVHFPIGICGLVSCESRLPSRVFLNRNHMGEALGHDRRVVKQQEFRCRG